MVGYRCAGRKQTRQPVLAHQNDVLDLKPVIFKGRRAKCLCFRRRLPSSQKLLEKTPDTEGIHRLVRHSDAGFKTFSSALERGNEFSAGNSQNIRPGLQRPSGAPILGADLIGQRQVSLVYQIEVLHRMGNRLFFLIDRPLDRLVFLTPTMQ